MSKVANKPVQLSSDIKFNITNNTIHIEGPKGKLEFVKPSDVTIEQNENYLNVSAKSESTAMTGTTRALINNMVTGVSKGWEKKLLLVGVGYRAKADKLKLELVVGYSHPVNLRYPRALQLRRPLKLKLLFMVLISKKLDK